MLEQIYCSLDLEFTGFDVTRDQILEIGFAFFRMTERGAEIIEEWSQVFKPSIEVHPKIFGLTGITQEELDAAPQFAEYRAFLQEKLGDAVIVGHNPIMDVKFLESYGIKLSGKTIDTLELVQCILPTHHSYNLENLMHYFNVAHEDAHRALGDCRTTILVLESLLRKYQSFSDTLKTALQSFLSRGDFSWKQLLEVPIAGALNKTTDSLSHLSIDNIDPLYIDHDGVTIDPIVTHHEARVAVGLVNSETPSLIAVAHSGLVMRLWQAGVAHGVFSSSDMFNRAAFDAFAKNATTLEELRFCIKVMVWLHTNWQTETILDLNISFFGGQFRSSIVGGSMVSSTDHVVVCDYHALSEAVLEPTLASRRLVVCDMQQFEKYISTGSNTKLSWNSVLYLLRLLYNPETGFGDQSIKEEVTQALIGADLFFGLTYLLLHKAYPQVPYIDIQKVSLEHPHIYRRLVRAAEHFGDKLSKVQGSTAFTGNESIIKFLSSFFSNQPGRVKWVMIDEHNTTFHDQPLEIASQVSQLLKEFSKVHFTETVTNTQLLSYYTERLGLNTELNDISSNSNKSQISRELRVSNQVAEYRARPELLQRNMLPCVIVMPNIIAVKQFYNEQYQNLKKFASVFAQGYSGGGNKMFKNFSLNQSGILIATAEFIAKQNHPLQVKSVIFDELPELELNHPYIQALVHHWGNKTTNLPAILIESRVVAALKMLLARADVTVSIYSSDNGVNNNRDFSFSFSGFQK